MTSLPPALARAIAASRDALNARWHAASYGRALSGESAPDGDAALETFAEIATALFSQDSSARSADEAAERVPLWLRDAFDAAVEAAGGSRLRADTMLVAARAAPALFSRDPARLLAMAARGAANVVSAGADPSRWLAILSAAGPALASLDDFAATGCVAAWLVGLAEYRPAAIAEMAAGRGKARLAIAPGSSATDAEAAARLAADPWLSARDAFFPDSRARAWVGCTGGQVLVGGPFVGLPYAEWREGKILAIDSGRDPDDPARERALVACPEGLRLLRADSPIPPHGRMASVSADSGGLSVDGSPIAVGPAATIAACPAPPALGTLEIGGAVAAVGAVAASSAVVGEKTVKTTDAGTTVVWWSARSYRLYIAGFGV